MSTSCRTTDFDRLAASTLTLLAAYARQAQDGPGCARLAFSVEQHLHCLADHPQTPVLMRATCEELLDDWYRLGGRHLSTLQDGPVARRAPAGSVPGKAARLLRLVVGGPAD